jgi:hypothetical protein
MGIHARKSQLENDRRETQMNEQDKFDKKAVEAIVEKSVDFGQAWVQKFIVEANEKFGQYSDSAIGHAAAIMLSSSYVAIEKANGLEMANGWLQAIFRVIEYSLKQDNIVIRLNLFRDLNHGKKGGKDVGGKGGIDTNGEGTRPKRGG